MEAKEALALTNRLSERLSKRRAQLQLWEDYYLGKQPLTFATREWKKANAARYSGFADNWCRPVVDAVGERIRHTGMKTDDRELQRTLWGWWQRNDMEAQSSHGFLATLYGGRSYVSVDGDSDGNPIMQWEHAGQVEIDYQWGNLRRRRAALKVWVEDEYEFATLYTRDEVWRWQRPRSRSSSVGLPQVKEARVGAGTGSWMPRTIDGQQWHTANVIGDVPFVEIPNRPLLFGEPVSEITPVAPLQDAINLLWAYLFLSADYASMPARVVLGQGPPKIPLVDEHGNKIGEKLIDIRDLQEKRLLYLQNPTAKIDSWEAAKLDVFTEVIEQAVGHIAAQTRTPPTYLITRTGMSNVSSEGLKASEIGLVKKTLEFQTFATPAIREIYRLAALVGGSAGMADAVMDASVSWMNPEIRSESQLADALMKKRSMGYPLEYLLELDGLSPGEVDRVLNMARLEQDAMPFTAAKLEVPSDSERDSRVRAATEGDLG